MCTTKPKINSHCVLSNDRVCYNMFFDEGLRVPQHSIGQSTDLTEDLYNPTDDWWRKIALHTPPYSPNQNWKRPQSTIVPQHAHSPVGLQVVPDDWAAEELSSDLPLVLSDAEFERLTSSTLGNDSPWQVGEVSDFEQSLENQQVHVTGSNQLACASLRRIELKALPTPLAHTEPLARNQQPTFGVGINGLATQDATLGHQASQRWIPYTVPYNQQILHRRQSDELVLRPSADSAGKRPRKSRRPSRGSPQRLDSTETDDPEENETSRATHNVLERQRREDLKYRFQVLRDSIPEIVDNERAPKVLILKKARECVMQLDREKERLLADKELERQRRLILLERLHALKQSYQTSYQTNSVNYCH